MKRTQFSTRKRIILAGLSLVLLLAPAVLLVVGVAQQQAGFDRTDQQLMAIQSQVSTIEDKKTSRDDRLKLIATLASTSQTTNCSGQWWNAWLQQFGNLQQHAERCRQSEQKIHESTLAVGALQAYLADDKKVADQLLRLRISTTDKNWQATALKNTEAVATTLAGMQAPKAAEPLLKVSKKQVGQIAAAWKSIEAADGKQDQAAYLKAEAQLKNAYSDLSLVANESDDRLRELAGVLITSAK